MYHNKHRRRFAEVSSSIALFSNSLFHTTKHHSRMVMILLGHGQPQPSHHVAQIQTLAPPLTTQSVSY